VAAEIILYLVMHILLIGNGERLRETQRKLAGVQAIIHVNQRPSTAYQIIIDLDFDEVPNRLAQYALLKDTLVILGTVQQQLAAIVHSYNKPVQCHLAALNALATFINRKLWEISLYNATDEPILEQRLKALGIEYRVVNDRVGMVTPRIVCMIINEACYTVQEGTASMIDIDNAMKLGTRYPHGPFEWADKIGVADVYKTLYALYHDTYDERYKICPMLKTYYLKQQRFYA